MQCERFVPNFKCWLKTMDGNWKFLSVVYCGQQHEIDGLDLWECLEKNGIGQRVSVIDPSYGQSHNFDVYEIKNASGVHRYAIGEFSNCAWGIYKEY